MFKNNDHARHDACVLGERRLDDRVLTDDLAQLAACDRERLMVGTLVAYALPTCTVGYILAGNVGVRDEDPEATLNRQKMLVRC